MANFAKEILNAKDALIYKKKSIFQEEEYSKANRILSYFYYYNKYHEIKPFQIFKHTAVNMIADKNTKKNVLKIIKKEINKES